MPSAFCLLILFLFTWCIMGSPAFLQANGGAREVSFCALRREKVFLEVLEREVCVEPSWRTFAYVMGANFQVLFLLIGAHELGKLCQGGGSVLCEWEAFFLPGALLLSGFVYYQVFRFLLRPGRRGK